MSRGKSLLVGASLLVGCAALFHPVPTAMDDPIRVPHTRHNMAKVECLACHENLYDQTELHTKDPLPPEAKCMECHKDKKESGQCSMCHSNVKKAGPWVLPQAGTIKMSHAKHIDLVKEDCRRCHEKLPEDRATPVGSLAPAMAACRSCHEHEKQYQQGRCEVCHTDLARFPLKPVSTFSHEGNFIKEHALVARTTDASCATCHDQTFCADCHAKTAHPRIELKMPERVDADFIHRNDFLGRHSVEAAGDPVMCKRCHGDSFCTGCHTAQGLTASSRDPRDPHPAGWSFPASANFHGPAARRDINQCAACHDEGPRTNCIGCHKVGGIGGDPHPTGWGDRHNLNEARSTRMCLYCHG